MSGLTPEQLEFRKGRVMASDAAAYLGLDPYRSPSAAWASNLQLIPDEENRRMDAGLYLEDGLARWAANDLMRDSFERPGSMAYLDWGGATPDVLFPEGDGVQLKVHALHMAADYTGMPFEFGDWSNNQVPERYNIQCQWEMLVTGADQWWLGAYFGGADFRLYPLVRDEELLGLMRRHLHAFWKRHLDPNGPQEQPPLDGMDSTTDYIRKKHRREREELIPATDEARALAQRFVEMRAREKEFAAAKAEAQNKLCDIIADADGIEGLCTWKPTNPKPRIDFEAIAKSYKTWPSRARKHTTTPEPQRRFNMQFKPSKEKANV